MKDFALLHRPQSGPPGQVEVLVGASRPVATLAELPVPPIEPGPDRHGLLVVLPYRQLTERGLACHDDATPLLAMPVARQYTVGVEALARRLPQCRLSLVDGRFEPDDSGYAAMVRDIVEQEIGRGAGSNFVLRRSFFATIPGYRTATALAVFRRLLLAEPGAYWTFLVRCGQRTLVGATPERHVAVDGTWVAMTPISGTYRYPPEGPTAEGLLRFLADGKESGELRMVLDEELKIMSRVCSDGGRVTGPFLRQMGRLAHTEYVIEGRSTMDVVDVLRETLFAPTVTGSPLANACRVIARHEQTGRGYYGGALALIGQRRGHRVLDSAIVIRAADVAADGRLEIGVGATLVRDSDPAAEAAETRAKAAGLLGAFATTAPSSRTRPIADLRIDRALSARNAGLARFWFAAPAGRERAALADLRLLVVDAEDAFTAMLAHQVRMLGAAVDVVRFDQALEPSAYDAVVLGPGPGDPRDLRDPRIRALGALTRRLLAARIPLLAVCLSHQILAGVLGFTLRRRAVPAQGVQREIDFFGRPEKVGFYNTFCAVGEGAHDALRASRDPLSGEIHALLGPGVCSVQFHPESVLTEHGAEILSELLTSLVGTHSAIGHPPSGVKN